LIASLKIASAPITMALTDRMDFKPAASPQRAFSCAGGGSGRPALSLAPDCHGLPHDFADPA